MWTISSHACAHLIVNRITLAGLFSFYSSTSDVGDHLELRSQDLFLEDNQLWQAVRCFTFLPDQRSQPHAIKKLSSRQQKPLLLGSSALLELCYPR